MISKEVWVDIKTLHRQGRSIRAITRETGLSRNTIRRHLRGEDPPRYRPRPHRASPLEPYKDYVRARLEKLPELPATVLLREIRSQGYGGQITILKDFIRPLRRERRRLEELTVRYETAPGEQAQVDWSEFGRLVTGQRLYGLGVVLGWSRTLFVYFTCRMTLQELLSGLVFSFEYFGGLPRKLLFDNPKSVVLVRGRTVADSTLHPRFLDFLGHYGLELQLCEPRRPQTKGKTERPMDYIWKSLVLPNLERWQSADDANRDARIWLDTVANVRVHGTTRERPFDRLPNEGLLPLDSVRPYDLSWTEPRRVHKDCHFSWEGNRYSVPWRCGSTAVLVHRHPGGLLQIERDGEVIASHHERPAGRGEMITLPEHVAGLWQKTLGHKRTYTPPAALLEPPPPSPALPLPELQVEARDLAVYQRFLEVAPLEVAP